MANLGAYHRHAAYRKRRKAKGNGMPRWVLGLIVIGALFVISAGVVAGVGYGVYRSYTNDLVTPAEEIAKLPLGGAEIRDRNGNFLYEFFDDTQAREVPL